MELDDRERQVRFLIHDRDAKFPHRPLRAPSNSLLQTAATATFLRRPTSVAMTSSAG
jgi:hypothetical protein